MKEIIHFEAYDGSVFPTKKECLEHEAKLSLQIYLENSDIDSRFESEDISEWIVKNYDIIKNIVEAN